MKNNCCLSILAGPPYIEQAEFIAESSIFIDPSHIKVKP
jgi:hypothetical protein